LLVLCLDFSSYYWFLQESQKIGRQQAASPCDARSEQQVRCLLADQRAKRLLLHFGSCDGGKPKGREQRQGKAGGGGTEQVRVEVGVASSEQRRGGNGLVRLELRGVAAGVPMAAWQLASEGVHARECAQTHGCKQMHPVSSNDQTVAAQRGGGRQRWCTTRRGCHLANGGARLGTACPAMVWPRGKVSAVMVENMGNVTARRRCPTPARYHTCERVDVCA
jgi:hypothetical protein